MGPEPMLAPVLAHLPVVLRLLKDTGRHRRALAAVASEWSTFAGRLHAALRHDDAALELFQRAEDLADGTLAATATSFRGYIARMRGRPRAVVRWANAALAVKGAHRSQRAFDTLQAARGHALMDDHPTGYGACWTRPPHSPKISVIRRPRCTGTPNRSSECGSASHNWRWDSPARRPTCSRPGSPRCPRPSARQTEPRSTEQHSPPPRRPPDEAAKHCFDAAPAPHQRTGHPPSPRGSAGRGRRSRPAGATGCPGGGRPVRWTTCSCRVQRPGRSGRTRSGRPRPRSRPPDGHPRRCPGQCPTPAGR